MQTQSACLIHILRLEFSLKHRVTCGDISTIVESEPCLFLKSILSYFRFIIHIYILHYITLHYIILHYIISYHIILYHIILYHIISYYIISYNIISYHTISYHIILYYIISYSIILYYIILYYLYYIILYEIILYEIILDIYTHQYIHIYIYTCIHTVTITISIISTSGRLKTPPLRHHPLGHPLRCWASRFSASTFRTWAWKMPGKYAGNGALDGC